MSYCFNDLKNTHTAEWQAYIEHDFVRQLGKGTLSDAAFRHYLQQDYLFLLHFGRAYALAVYKSQNTRDLRHALAGQKIILETELQLHIDYCKEWGISEEALEQLPEARATLAYTRYVFDAGSRGNLLDLHVALAPCLVGYAEVSQYLSRYEKTTRKNNPYEKWLQMYESDAFQNAAKAEIEWLDERLAQVSEERFNELAKTFRDATRLEIDFWQAGLEQLD